MRLLGWDASHRSFIAASVWTLCSIFQWSVSFSEYFTFRAIFTMIELTSLKCISLAITLFYVFLL